MTLSVIFLTSAAGAEIQLARSGLSSALPAPMTLTGVGGVAPGMTAAQVERAWGIRVVPTGKGPCRMARIATSRVRGHGLFLEGRLGALFFTAGIRSDRGVGVGSTLDELNRAYGRSIFYWPAPESRTAVHAYTRPRYRGDKRALRFDLDPRGTGRVTQIGLGGPVLAFSTGRC